ncbi:MAG: Xaa-Pro peptidase family protein [Peptoniphilus harei]|uniref:M24 family metallopeptidase n=1 Tax=Peptoniphilus harei TaxID=54005 RepID=UPI0029028F14|nr:Xaa-Pro peptidase family protein [Peptoniphilus harei]MDU3087665.1 Xaa-Pro peptidase family protein [Peptoniphilus harei]
MHKNRIDRLINKMEEENLHHMIISDPYAIFYLLDKMIEPGERALALYIHRDGDVKLLINELFPQEEEAGVDFICYNDIEDGIEKLSKFIKDDELIGIDKFWSAKFLLRLQEIFPDKKYVNGSTIVDHVRRIKDEEEKQLMRESSAINDKVMEELIPWVVKGLSEKELSQKLKEIYKANGVEEVSFEPITAYGRSAADPHHSTDKTKGKVGDCVVLDIGGIYKNYASDMTRTVFIGEVSDRAREIYEIVKEANLRGIAAAKPGNKMSDVDKAARSYIEEKGYGKYFTHRTGHSIGLECHEEGDVSSVNDSLIEVGQIFSIEPGIYLLEEGIGVRIEDLVLITEDGCEVLNKVSKDLKVVPMN